VPAPGGVEMALTVTDPNTNETTIPLKLRPLIYAKSALSEGSQVPPPPARPICLAAIYNEFDIQIGGVLESVDKGVGTTGQDPEQLIANSRAKWPVGWEAIEIYPPLGEEHWRPEYAANWAELDILAGIAQQNAMAMNLNALDSRGATRKYYAALLEEFEGLL